MNDKAASKAEKEHPGAALKAARERQGASIAAVATSAHLDESLVAALEEGRYEAFHAPAYVYGYIRAYARFVGVDADPLVRRLDPSWEDSSPPVEMPQPLKPPLADRAQRYLGPLFGGLVAIVLIAAAVVLWMAGWSSSDWRFWMSDETQDETTQTVDTPAANIAPVAAPSREEPTPSRNPSPGTGFGDTEPMEGDAVGTEANIETGATERFVAPAPTTEAVIRTTAEPTGAGEPPSIQETGSTPGEDAEATEAEAQTPLDLTLLPPDELALVFEDDSWVEVEDAHGETIHADLGNSGESYSIYGEAPFHIVVGYAPGVQVAFNGEPVALRPHTRSSVARLVVGL